MAINKERNARLTLTMNKNSIDLISKFASALNLTKSEFIESVCCNYIVRVVKQAEEKETSACGI